MMPFQLQRLYSFQNSWETIAPVRGRRKGMNKKNMMEKEK
jgi:hypothetical protein